MECSALPIASSTKATPPALGLSKCVKGDAWWSCFTGVKRERDPSPLVDHDAAERIKDMDYEGVDVNLTLPSGWFGTWTTSDDVALEAGMFRTYHRWMDEYCGAYPEGLGGVILACGRDVEGSVAEIRGWGKSRWA